MKRRDLIAGLALAPLLARAAGRMGTHGMALFGGRDGLYASHLPMFHTPHDVQLVLRLHIEDQATDSALRAALEGRTALWTINPETFDLNHIQAGMRFQADLVAGHFERGGKARWHAVTVIVDEVILRQALSAELRNKNAAFYRKVGNFLVKEIDSRPDFDHIVALEKPMGLSRISVPKHGLVQPDVRTLQNAAGVKVRGTVYFELDDLK